jgi:hypothetical protein
LPAAVVAVFVAVVLVFAVPLGLLEVNMEFGWYTGLNLSMNALFVATEDLRLSVVVLRSLNSLSTISANHLDAFDAVF